MATYTYRCSNEDCKNEFDVKQSMNDEKLVQCPECLKDTLQRVITASAVVFKGRGWFGKGGY